jgi:hypothetical protein
MDAPEAGMKRCSACKQWKPVDQFNQRAKSRDGRQPKCRTCSRAYHQINQAQRNAQIHARSRRIIRDNQRHLYEYLLEHPCVDCGETDVAVLEFDHLRDKVGNVALLLRASTWDVVLQEIAKCEVRCANCHRRRTYERAGSWRIVGLDDEPV